MQPPRALLAALLLCVLLQLGGVMAMERSAEAKQSLAARRPGHTLPEMYHGVDHVFAGVVLEVDSKDHEEPGISGWVSRHFRVALNVTDVAKTRLHGPATPEEQRDHLETERTWRHSEENLPPHDGDDSVEHPEHVEDPLHDDESMGVGDIVHVHYWRTLHRPPGYTPPATAHGAHGMREDVDLRAGQKIAVFAQYLHRDHNRRHMYRHTYPGAVRRRRHAVDGEDFEYVNAYVALSPDGISHDVAAALAAGSDVPSLAADL